MIHYIGQLNAATTALPLLRRLGHSQVRGDKRQHNVSTSEIYHERLSELGWKAYRGERDTEGKGITFTVKGLADFLSTQLYYDFSKYLEI